MGKKKREKSSRKLFCNPGTSYNNSVLNKLPFLLLILFSLGACATREAPLLQQEAEGQDIVDLFSEQDERLEKFRVVREEDPPKAEQTTLLESKKEQVTKKPVPGPVKKSEGPKKEEPAPPKEQTPRPDLRESEEGVEFDGDELPEEFVDYDEISKPVWERYTPLYFPNEEMHFAIKYLGITAGHIRVVTKPLATIDGRAVMHYQGHMRSARFYEYFYRLDDSIETYVDAKRQIPIRYALIQRESGQNVDDLQVFDHEANKTYFWYKRVKDGKTKEEEKEAFVPDYFHDSFSALFFARGLPYKVGDVYEFPIVTRTRLWLLKMDVEQIEEISIMKKRVPAYRVRAVTRFPGVLERRGDILFWFSADEQKKLLKFRASVKIGAIEGELIEYKPGQATPEF